jgi:hypothetical protein
VKIPVVASILACLVATLVISMAARSTALFDTASPHRSVAEVVKRQARHSDTRVARSAARPDPAITPAQRHVHRLTATAQGRTLADTLAFAHSEMLHSTSDWAEQCLGFVRVAWHEPSPPFIGTAREAWDLAKHKEYNTEPPAGAPVYWAGGSHGYGHIALSAGHGMIYSTDIRRIGKVDLVPLDEIRARWGLRYLGWSRDYPIDGPLPLGID